MKIQIFKLLVQHLMRWKHQKRKIQKIEIKKVLKFQEIRIQKRRVESSCLPFQLLLTKLPPSLMQPAWKRAKILCKFLSASNKVRIIVSWEVSSHLQIVNNTNCAYPNKDFVIEINLYQWGPRATPVCSSKTYPLCCCCLLVIDFCCLGVNSAKHLKKMATSYVQRDLAHSNSIGWYRTPLITVLLICIFSFVTELRRWAITSNVVEWNAVALWNRRQRGKGQRSMAWNPLEESIMSSSSLKPWEGTNKNKGRLDCWGDEPNCLLNTFISFHINICRCFIH